MNATLILILMVLVLAGVIAYMRWRMTSLKEDVKREQAETRHANRRAIAEKKAASKAEEGLSKAEATCTELLARLGSSLESTGSAMRIARNVEIITREMTEFFRFVRYERGQVPAEPPRHAVMPPQQAAAPLPPQAAVMPPPQAFVPVSVQAPVFGYQRAAVPPAPSPPQPPVPAPEPGSDDDEDDGYSFDEDDELYPLPDCNQPGHPHRRHQRGQVSPVSITGSAPGYVQDGPAL